MYIVIARGRIMLVIVVSLPLLRYATCHELNQSRYKLHTKWATTCTIGSSIYKNLKLKKKEKKKRMSITLRSLIYGSYGSMSARRANRKPFAKLQTVCKAVRNTTLSKGPYAIYLIG
jgi:hypothetical protein